MTDLIHASKTLLILHRRLPPYTDDSCLAWDAWYLGFELPIIKYFWFLEIWKRPILFELISHQFVTSLKLEYNAKMTTIAFQCSVLISFFTWKWQPSNMHKNKFEKNQYIMKNVAFHLNCFGHQLFINKLYVLSWCIIYYYKLLWHSKIYVVEIASH